MDVPTLAGAAGSRRACGSTTAGFRTTDEPPVAVEDEMRREHAGRGEVIASHPIRLDDK